VPEDDEQRRGPRGFWSGTIAFGLVSLPVSLFVANRPGRVSLRMVDEDGTPLNRRYFCSREERMLRGDEIVRGYEVEKDKYVVVEDDELEALAPEKSREIDLQRFVAVSDIDPAYFERAYFLVPGGGGAKPYRLLARAMQDAGRAGIATFIMRGKEYLVAIVAEGGILRAEILRFRDELRSPEDVGLPKLAKPAADRVREIGKAMRKLHAGKLEEDELHDRYARRLEDLVQRKLDAGEDVVEAPEETEPSGRDSADVIDLLQVLKERMSEPDDARPKRSTDSGSGDLEGRSKPELYERAKALGIAGRSGMNKKELIAAIRDA
jgi:DNA end-binding protein Ku